MEGQFYWAIQIWAQIQKGPNNRAFLSFDEYR
jgi:hypothetical protein